MGKNNFANIGILGGSFDPPHKGHLYISKKSIKLLNLKKVIWAITKKNPLKKSPFFSLTLRKKLCRKLIKRHKKIQFNYYEDKLKSKTSIALLNFLKNVINTKFFSLLVRITLLIFINGKITKNY